MKTSHKLTIGFLSALPTLYFAVFILTVIITIYNPNLDPYMDFVFLLEIPWILLMIGLIIYYHFFISRSKEIPADSKKRIRIRLYMGTFWFILLYWYKYIWKNSTYKITNQLA